MPARIRSRRRNPAPVSGALQGLGDRLRKARIEAGLSQSQLGAPHFTRAYVSALELGKIRPAMKSLEFLAAKLGKPTSYFLEDEEQQRKRREREAVVARAAQLIAQGAARAALEELESVDDEGLPLADRLAIKRTRGRALLEAGDAGKAAAVLSDAVRGYEALGEEEPAARARGQLGAALIALMSYAEAEENLNSALRTTVNGVVKDPLFRVQVLHNLGLIFYQRGDYKAALGHLERAAEEGSDIADQKWLASLFAAVGMSRRQVGDYEGAIASLHKSEALFEAIHNKSRVAEIRFQTARTLRALGNRAKATAMLEEAGRAAEAAENESLAIRIQAFIGLSLAVDGKEASAAEMLRGLLPRSDAADPMARFAVRFALARAISETSPEESEVLLRDLAAGLEARPPSDELAQVYDELARALRAQGRSDEAIAYAQQAYATTQQAKKGGI